MNNGNKITITDIKPWVEIGVVVGGAIFFFATLHSTTKVLNDNLTYLKQIVQQHESRIQKLEIEQEIMKRLNDE